MKALGALAISAAAAFVTGLALFHFGMLAFVRSGTEARVPDLVGLDLGAARAELEEAGFAGVAEREVHSPDFGEGAVIEQRPDAGRVLRRGRKVYLTVSLGLRKAVVPSVTGTSYRQALIALNAEKLAGGSVSRVHHSRIRRGSVIAQDPPAAAPLPEGGRVNLLVSLGPPPESYTMVNLCGRSLREAESLLQRHGLRVGEKTVLIDRSVLPGTVLEHEPSMGHRVRTGDAIDVVVSARR